MVEINKAEAKYLRENGKKDKVHITRTMITKSKRHKYFVCEEVETINLLNDYRKTHNVVFTYGNVL